MSTNFHNTEIARLIKLFKRMNIKSPDVLVANTPMVIHWRDVPALSALMNKTSKCPVFTFAFDSNGGLSFFRAITPNTYMLSGNIEGSKYCRNGSKVYGTNMTCAENWFMHHLTTTHKSLLPAQHKYIYRAMHMATVDSNNKENINHTIIEVPVMAIFERYRDKAAAAAEMIDSCKKVIEQAIQMFTIARELQVDEQTKNAYQQYLEMRKKARDLYRESARMLRDNCARMVAAANVKAKKAEIKAAASQALPV